MKTARSICGRRNERAFTLVELMVTVTMVAILATAAVPMYRGCIDFAKMSEGIAGCGTIRTAMRVYKAAHGHYPVLSGALGDNLQDIGIFGSGLDGKYFDAGSYQVTSNGVDYTITATYSADMTYALDQDGTEQGTVKTE